MNGLEAVNKLKNESYCNCSLSDDNKLFCMGGLLKDSDELKAIERELKVNQILKEKKVMLALLDKTFDIYHLNNDELTRQYNALMRDEDNLLTEEEMQLIVEWIKGE